jgi:hypothetical protein
VNNDEHQKPHHIVQVQYCHIDMQFINEEIEHNYLCRPQNNTDKDNRRFIYRNLAEYDVEQHLNNKISKNEEYNQYYHMRIKCQLPIFHILIDIQHDIRRINDKCVESYRHIKNVILKSIQEKSC